MFDDLTYKLEGIFKKLKGHGKLTEKNISEATKQVRRAFLEADVNYKVVKRLVEDIRKRAIGQEVLESLTPGQQLIKIVNDELRAEEGVVKLYKYESVEKISTILLL